MSLLTRLDLDELSPAALWSALDDGTREEAARAVYNDGSGSARLEADAAIAKALRFRPAAVRQLPLERRVGYLLKSVYVDDSLATTLLLALHLDARSEMLETFLDELGIPQQGGLIDEGHELEPPGDDDLARAIARIDECHDASQTDLYLASLLAMDPVTWGGLRDAIAARR